MHAKTDKQHADPAISPPPVGKYHLSYLSRDRLQLSLD